MHFDSSPSGIRNLFARVLRHRRRKGMPKVKVICFGVRPAVLEIEFVEELANLRLDFMDAQVRISRTNYVMTAGRAQPRRRELGQLDYVHPAMVDDAFDILRQEAVDVPQAVLHQLAE